MERPMTGFLADGQTKRGMILRWIFALAPLVPLIGTLAFGGAGHGITLALQVLFTIAAGCHLMLAFELVAKLRNRGAGQLVPDLRAAIARVALSFVLFWVAFAIALGVLDAPAHASFPAIYVLYCVAMLALLLVAFVGAWFLGRASRARTVKRADRKTP